ncbi:rhodanese-like domain-containing protein [Halobacteriovorax sp.]|uniref:rhodanese-like domain-containing protein n=1 Tax=Halobacteriovorax sp. TaxID=2020862 RepID=UPI003564E859
MLIIIVVVTIKIYRSKVSKKEMDAIEDIDTIQFVDVRSKNEFLAYSLPKSTNIPVNALKRESIKLNKNVPVVVFCVTGTRSAIAKVILRALGFEKIINAGTVRNVQKYLKSRS